MSSTTTAATDPALLALAEDFYRDEMRDHATYLTLAGRERDARLRELLGRVASMELNHAGFWKTFLEARGAPVPAVRLSRTRLWLLEVLQRLINPKLLVSALELGETSAYQNYFRCLKSASLDEPERARLRAIILDELEHELTFRKEAQRLGGQHVRDYVLGMNDGLVEILGAVTGLSAIYTGDPLIVAVSGLVVGIAGALSMGIGAYISVRSQRQVNEGKRARMEVLFDVAPHRAVEEYRERLAESGLPADLAGDIAQRMGSNREALARLLLEESEENELRSGLFTGLAYLLGVAFPVLPYFLASNSLTALFASVGFAGFALAASATVVSVLSGIPLKQKITEMLIAGFSAAAIAYGFGKLVQNLFGIVV
jgi:VIT1/CCC1 family predicted Fe2+/Mn2+ transporter